MAYPTNNLRIKSTRVVLPPIFLEEEMPVTESASRTVFEARRQIIDILNGADDRLLAQVNAKGERTVVFGDYMVSLGGAQPGDGVQTEIGHFAIIGSTTLPK